MFRIASKVFMNVLSLPWIVVLFGFVFLHSGCVSKSSCNTPALTIAIYDDPFSLSPDQAKRALDLSIAKLLFEGLTRENATLSSGIELALASHYRVSTDATTYTFFLKPNACWSDGSKITAHDVIKSWEHAKQSSPHHQLFEGINFYPNSSSEITLTLNIPNPQLLHLLSSPAFAVFNPNNLNIFSGPFRLLSHTPNHSLALEKNIHYYDQDKVAIDSLRLLVVPDFHTASLLLQRGEIQWLGQPWHQGLTKELKDSSSYHYTYYPVEGIFWITINTQDPFLSHYDNRYRVASAINREEIIQHALQSNQEPAYGLTRQSQPNRLSEKQTINPSPIKLKLTYPANIFRCQCIAEILKEQLKIVSIDLILEGLDYHVFLNKRKNHDFSLATGTGVAYYPQAHILTPEASCLIKNLEILPIYHMTHDYLTTLRIENILYNASGAVDLKYAYLSLPSSCS